MKNEIKKMLKKSAKIAGVTCLALGSAALIASGAALKALAEGTKHIKDSVERIIHEETDATEPEAEVVEEAPAQQAEPVVAEAEVTTKETV